MKQNHKLLLIAAFVLFILYKNSKNNFSAASDKYSLSNSNDNVSIDKDSVLIFHAGWCGHCKRAMPEFKKAQIDGRGKVVLIDADERPDLVNKYNVQGYPTIMKADRTPYTGDRNASDIMDFLNEN